MQPTERLCDYLVAWETDFLAGSDRAPDELAPDAPEIWTELRQRIARRRRMLRFLAADSPGFRAVETAGTADDSLDAEEHRKNDLAEILRQIDPPQGGDELGRLGEYRLLRLLGQGGMGAVFVAEDMRLNRKVALKVMLPSVAGTRASRQRFLREARTAAQIKCDHVVTIYDVGEAKGTPYIAMEYLDGTSLDSHLKANGEVRINESLRIARETALGLQAAHELGVVHRDIKPANLWLEAPSGRVKILDFGLVHTEKDAHLTSSDAIVGTPAYMSPEQARGEAVDARSDLFSLGGVLYRLLTGHRPFKGNSTMATVMSLGADEPTPVNQMNSHVSNELAAIVHRLLAKNPAERIPTAADVAGKLLELERRLDPTNPPPVFHHSPEKGNQSATQVIPPDATSTGVSRERSKKRARLLVIAAGIVCLAAVWPIIAILRSATGVLVIETSEDVPLVVKRDGEPVRRLTGERNIELPVGKYTIELADANDGARLSRDSFEISRNAVTNIALSLRLPESAWFREIHGATEAEILQWVDSLPAGFQPDWISGRVAVQPMLYDAIARPTLDSFERRLIFDSGTHEEFEQFGKSYGLQFKDFVLTEGKNRVVSIWTTDTAKPWLSRRGTPAFVLGEARAAQAEYRPHSLSAKITGAGTEYSLVMRKGIGPSWHIQVDLSSAELEREIALQRARGWRLEFVSIFGNQSPRFQACFAENSPARSWSFASGLSESEYEAQLRVNQRRGFEPASVVSWADGGQPLYAVVWDNREERARPEGDRFPAANPAVKDFQEAHGLSEEELQAWVDSLPAGFRPEWVCARHAHGDPCFDVIAIRDEQPVEWKFYLHSIPDAEGVWEKMGSLGYRYLRDSRYLQGNWEPKVAQIWVKDGRRWAHGTWTSDKPLDDALYRARGDGDIPVHCWQFEHEGSHHYGLVNMHSPGWRWKVERDIAVEELPAAIAKQRQTGFRPVSLMPTYGRQAAQFTAVFIENRGNIKWDASTSISAKDYENELATRKGRGMRPQCVCSYGSGETITYSLIWVEYSKE